MKNAKTLKQVLLSFHIIFASIWIGTAFVILFLIFNFHRPESVADFKYFWNLIALLNSNIFTISFLLTIISGITLLWQSKWFYLKYYWILFKIGMTFIILVLKFLYIGRWINDIVGMIESLGFEAFYSPIYSEFILLLKIWLALHFMQLVVIFFISIFKPWGRIEKSNSLI